MASSLHFACSTAVSASNVSSVSFKSQQLPLARQYVTRPARHHAQFKLRATAEPEAAAEDQMTEAPTSKLLHRIYIF
jgi:hypothetical protein